MVSLGGRTVRGYQIREFVGEGVLGSVYLAQQSATGRDVAIKVLHAAVFNHPEFVRHFEADIQLLSRLEYPHLVTWYDYRRDSDGLYLVMRKLSTNLSQALS